MFSWIVYILSPVTVLDPFPAQVESVLPSPPSFTSSVTSFELIILVIYVPFPLSFSFPTSTGGPIPFTSTIRLTSISVFLTTTIQLSFSVQRFASYANLRSSSMPFPSIQLFSVHL